MKPTVYALFFIIVLVSVTAGNVGKAEVHVTVVNNPPEILDINTSEPFEDEPLRCNVLTKDEIEDVWVRYKWYKNGVLIEGQEENVLEKEFVKKDDVIMCEATPNDVVQDGEPKSVSVTIKPKPLVSAITGAVIGFGESQGFLNSFLFLLLIALVIFTVAHFSKRK